MRHSRRSRTFPTIVAIGTAVVAIGVATWASGLIASPTSAGTGTGATTTASPGRQARAGAPSASPSPATSTAAATASTRTRRPAATATATRAHSAAPVRTTRAAPVSRSCTDPVFVTSDRNGGWSTHGYYVHNNMWNSDYGLGPETLSACSYRNWSVTSRQTDHDGAVLTYPNVHKDYDDIPVRSFRTLTSTFAATSPHVGIYNVAYDIWLNGVADSGSTEVMIWTENYRQVPSGRKVTTVTLGGRTYRVWKTSDSRYIAFVPTSVVTAGRVDLRQMFSWLMGKGWLARDATVGQIDYGVEIVSTGGRTATFTFTDFSITDD
jgi:hypothetical protein